MKRLFVFLFLSFNLLSSDNRNINSILNRLENLKVSLKTSQDHINNLIIDLNGICLKFQKYSKPSIIVTPPTPR